MYRAEFNRFIVTGGATGKHITTAQRYTQCIKIVR